MTDNIKDSSPSITRRTFLKALGGTALGIGLAGSTELENLRESSNIHIIDFAPTSGVAGLEQKSFPDNEGIIKQLAGDEYRSKVQLVAEFGIDFNSKKRKFLFDEIYHKYPSLGIALGLFSHFEHHGEMVWKTSRQVLEAHNIYKRGSITPLQDLIDFSRIRTQEDELGNKEYFLKVNPEPIIQALKNVSQNIVNLSFQLGEVGLRVVEKDYKIGEVDFPTVYYVEDKENELYLNNPDDLPKDVIVKSPMTTEEYNQLIAELTKRVITVVDQSASFQIIDSYTNDKAEKNLDLLFRIKKELPNKLIFAAAGNYDDDLRWIDPKAWPNGLVLCAEWDDNLGKPVNQVFGAQIYVNSVRERIGKGSSNATPFVAAYAEILLSKGVSMDKIKQVLLENCDSTKYKAIKHTREKGIDIVDVSEETAMILNIGKLDMYIKSLDD